MEQKARNFWKHILVPKFKEKQFSGEVNPKLFDNTTGTDGNPTPFHNRKDQN